MAGSVLGVHRAFQYGSGQIQSIVAKAVVRRLHIKDVLEYIRGELPVLQTQSAVNPPPLRPVSSSIFLCFMGDVMGEEKSEFLKFINYIIYLIELSGGARSHANLVINNP